MAWPTRAQVQAIYLKVNHTDLNTKVDQGIEWGKNRVLAAMSRLYDVSGFAASTPPALFDLVLRYAYAYASGEAVHSGQRLTASDDLAVRIIEACDADLLRYASGEWPLLGADIGDEAGDVIAPRTRSGFVHLRTAQPVMTMAPIEDQVLELVEEGEEFQ